MHPGRKLLQLDAIGTRCPPDHLEGLVDARPEPFGDHALRLLDRDARLQRVLELGAAVQRAFHGAQEAAYRRGRRLDASPPDLTFNSHRRDLNPPQPRGRSSTASSQSRASAIRSSVSIRGGRPPASSRAIADCVVPTSSASSRCESFRALRCAWTWSAMRAKNHPSPAPARRARAFSPRCERGRSRGWVIDASIAYLL